MRFLFLILSIFFICPSAYASIPVNILKIYDGDTIKVKLENGNKFSIRLQGIDCYETSKIHRAYKQAYINNISIDEVVRKGTEAQEAIKKLYKKYPRTSFEFNGIDRYGRAPGTVYFNKININQYLLKNNLCIPYEFNENK